MRFLCKLFSVNGIPAADGSTVSEQILREYLSSPTYEEGIQNHSFLGTITHRFRSAENIPNNLKSNNLHKCVGKDDGMIMPDVAAPTHYIEELFIQDGWCWAKCKVLDLEGADEVATNYIKRLRWMLTNGIGIGVSMICVAMWGNNSGTGTDVCRKIISIKGLDVTANSSWKQAKIISAWDDEGERMFSTTEDFHYDIEEGVQVRAFSNVSDITPRAPRTSNINGEFCFLKGKVFSNFEPTIETQEESVNIEEKQFSVPEKKERLRMATKLPPRMRFRRLVMEYKALVKTMGGVEKMDPETVKVLRSLIATDILDIFKTITPEIIAGKQVNVLLGASTLGKNARVAAQKLQIPLKQGLIMSTKQGYISKNIYEKLQTLYSEFIQSITDDILNPKSTIPDLKEGEEVEGEEKETK